MTDHLGYDKHAPEGRGSGNSRNGTSAKTIQGDHGEVPLEVPRDREPQMIPKGQRRLPGFDEKVILSTGPGDDNAGDPGPSARALRR